ncbi:MAG: 2-amino-4-hydroxy-6-hydroxymethyldihydropteridine diphosphokinase [Paracoccaceae bacterium]
MAHGTILLALGANLPSRVGPPTATLRQALAELGRSVGEIGTISRFFVTEAVPAGSGPDFVNAAASLSLRQEWTAEDLLSRLHGIEAALGRRRGRRWGARTLDIDLLGWGARVLPDRAAQAAWMALGQARAARTAPPAVPVLPHPRLHERAFVLVPLAEVAPGWVHPATGLDVTAMLARLPEAERAAVKPFDAGMA